MIRIAGASFPGASSLVQLQGELDAKEFSDRIRRLEDPISFLHDDVPELSKHLYEELKRANYIKLVFEDEFYENFSRPIATLAAMRLIRCDHALGRHIGKASSIGYLAIRSVIHDVPLSPSPI